MYYDQQYNSAIPEEIISRKELKIAYLNPKTKFYPMKKVLERFKSKNAVPVDDVASQTSHETASSDAEEYSPGEGKGGEGVDSEEGIGGTIINITKGSQYRNPWSKKKKI